MSLAFSAAGLLLSLFAIATSTLLLVRQTAFMRHANEIPVSIDLYQEYRSAEFQEAEGYVRNSLATAFDPNLGISKLADEARKSVRRVTSFYTSLGALVVLGLADERFVVPLLGGAANNSWKVLEPYILREREIQKNDDILVFYEDLVQRTREKLPVMNAYGIRLKKITNWPTSAS